MEAARCRSCDAENRPGAKFCDRCGGGLARTCTSCSTELRPEARFCDACGSAVGGAEALESASTRVTTPQHLAQKILTSRSILEGERKQVTVLFADVKGSMDLAEQVDAEDWHKILERFFEILTDGVHRFEGTVNQYTGDGIMALFGAPIAHEDHAQRACYAALHLRQELRRYADELRTQRGMSFSVRMGINSGEVVIGKIGDDLRMDYTAQGHTVGLAQRMEQLAEPGHAYLTEHTAKLVSGYFTLRDLGPLAVKGSRDPVRVHALEGAGTIRTRLDISRVRGFSKFVGRADEMAVLEDALANALRGDAQVVGIVADAGVGKSRLCFEFLEHCRARGLSVLEGRAVAHGKNVPYLPILQTWRSWYGITEQDSDRVAREKIAGRLLLLDDTLRDVLPIIFEFMGVPDPERPTPRIDPEVRQRELYAAIKVLVPRGVDYDSGVTLIEDLHWIDSGSEGLIEQLVEALEGSHNLLLLNFRPEYREPWADKPYHRRLELKPLGETDVRTLLDDLLGPDPTLADLGRMIQAQTKGNPFFTEEVVRTLVESGHLAGSERNYRLATPVDRIVVPATVQSVLAARIDRLAEHDKNLLCTAAVIGKEFTKPVLQLVRAACDESSDVETSLQALADSEFVYQTALYPVEEYAFKHPLTQEVAYGSQLGDRRRRIHAAVARAVETVDAARLDERAALVAYHREWAGELLEAARWHRRAAEWLATSDVSAAHRHWTKVRELVKALPESTETLALGIKACVELVNLGWRAGTPLEESEATFACGRTLAERAGDHRSLALLLANYGVVGGLTHADDRFACYEEARRLAAESKDATLEVAVGCLLAPHAMNGRLRETLRIADELLQINDVDLAAVTKIMHVAPVPWLFTLKGFVKTVTGRVAEGAADFAHVSRLLEESDSTINRIVYHSWRSRSACLIGDGESALDHARRAAALLDKVGGQFWECEVCDVFGQAHALRGDWTEAIPLLERAVPIFQALKSRVSWTSVTLALGLCRTSEAPRARALIDEVIAAAQREGGKLMELTAQLVCTAILLETEGRGARPDAEAHLKRASVLIDETGAVIFKPQILLARAELARVLGDDAARTRSRAEAQRLYAEMGATARAEQLAAELA